MVAFYQEPQQPPHHKRCKVLAAVIKEAFANCHSFNGRRFSSLGPEEESSGSEIDGEEEDMVSEIRSRAMEKKKLRPKIAADSISWMFSPSTGEIFITSKNQKGQEEDDEREEFLSAGSCFSLCSDSTSKEEFLSMKTNLSRSSSLNRLESENFWKFDTDDFRRRSIIQEFCHCEGWPFGLCRKAVLLPPLPKSPSDSWKWRKGMKLAKTPYV